MDLRKFALSRQCHQKTATMPSTAAATSAISKAEFSIQRDPGDDAACAPEGDIAAAYTLTDGPASLSLLFAPWRLAGACPGEPT